MAKDPRADAPAQRSLLGRRRKVAGTKGDPSGKAGTKGKAVAAKAPKRPRVGLSQMRQAFSLTRKSDPKMVPIVLAALLVTFAVVFALGFLVGHPVYFGFLAVLLGLLAATFTFGRRASASAFAQVEGQPGAAAAVLNSLRGNWRVQPAIAFTAQQDFVHRVVGRPGIILVGEGAAHRVKGLIAQEKKKAGRLVGDAPVYDVMVGDAEGQVSLRKLNKHMTKMPRNIKPAQINVLDRRLAAMGGANLPIPKGPMPRSGRVPRR